MQLSSVNGELFHIWSVALLVALGGTNSMTAYVIEDNEQYWRHFVQQLLYVINFFAKGTSLLFASHDMAMRSVPRYLPFKNVPSMEKTGRQCLKASTH
jgi:hypothetical protein